MLKRTLGILLVGMLLAGGVQAQDDPITITWFVGLGAGNQPEQLEAQNKVVEEFNARRDDIQLEILVVDGEVANEALQTLIEAGNAPDLVGPVGIWGASAYAGQWLDLQPLVDASAYDLGRWEPSLVDFYRIEGEGLVALPFAVYPSMLFYNRDLFDAAGLDYPPHRYGDPYADGDTWTVEKMTELALLLTLDANGNNANSADFDPENIVQFGYVNQWTDEARDAATTPFGAGSLVDDEGKAQIPEAWRVAYKWYYEGMWVDYFMPNEPYLQAPLLDGNAFGSGHVAMASTHLWYTCCVEAVKWDIAAIPSYNGVTTAKLHADTFRLLNSTQNPQAAFEVLTYLVGDAAPALLQVYGGMPADPATQAAFLETLDQEFPQGVDWQVAIDGLEYPDNPSHEGYLPNFLAADAVTSEFWVILASTPDLDLAAALDQFQANLQAVFDAPAE